MKRFLSITTLVLMAFAAYGSPVKSDLAAKGIELEDNGSYIPTAADYIQDGLVAMWDGIENAGWGMHNSDRTKPFVELVSGAESAYGNNGSGFYYVTIGDDYIQLDNNRFLALYPSNLDFSNVQCVEACMDATSISTSSSLDRAILGWGGNKTNLNGLGLTRNGYLYFRVGDTRQMSNHLVSLTKQTISADANSIKVNGVAQSSRTETNLFMYGTQAICGRIGNNGYGVQNLKMHNIRLYSRALTAEEILHNYLIDKMRFGL